MAIKVEVFISQPPCSGSRQLLKLIEEIKREYGERIKVEIYRGHCDKTKEYGIKYTPALVIDRDIRIIGVCPTKRTIKEALREAGIV